MLTATITALTPYRVAIAAGALLFLILGTLRLSRWLLARFRRHTAATPSPWDAAMVAAIGAPLRLLIWIIGLAIGAKLGVAAMTSLWPGLGATVGDSISTGIATLRDLGIIATVAWFVLRAITQAQTTYLARAVAAEQVPDRAAVEAVGKLLHLSVLILAVLFTLQSLGFSLTGILTFGGIGGIAIGFAAQGLLANFFGGLLIYLDKPFAVGDWIRSPDQEIEGVVEAIGWRVTRVLTFDNRPLYVPNAIFTTLSIENVARMTHRKIYETIGVRYADAAAVANLIAAITTYLKTHPAIAQDQTLLVNFTTFAPSSLNFFIYCYTKTCTGAEYFPIKQEILLRILAIIDEHKAECAFPTMTLDLPEGVGGMSG